MRLILKDKLLSNANIFAYEKVHEEFRKIRSFRVEDEVGRWLAQIALQIIEAQE